MTDAVAAAVAAIDTDRLGNTYFVYIWLLADTPEELNATLPHYEAILRAY